MPWSFSSSYLGVRMRDSAIWCVGDECQKKEENIMADVLQHRNHRTYTLQGREYLPMTCHYGQ
jgi:hypothetical protein